MASGVAVDPKCVEVFKQLKERKNRCVVFKINEGMTAIEVEKTLPLSGGSPKDDWEEFTKALPESDCRYIAYDFAYEHQGAPKQRILFVLWSPEYAKVRPKMIYASSQEGVVNKLEGVQRQLQCTDSEELEYAAISKQLAAHTAGY